MAERLVKCTATKILVSFEVMIWGKRDQGRFIMTVGMGEGGKTRATK